MPVAVEDQHIAISRFITAIIKSSIQIIIKEKEKEQIDDFIDEALLTVLDKSEDKTEEEPTSNDNMSGEGSTESSEIHLSGTMETDAVTSSHGVKEDITVTNEDGRQQDITDYIQNIIKEASGKTFYDSMEFGAKMTDTDDSLNETPSKISANNDLNANSKQTTDFAADVTTETKSEDARTHGEDKMDTTQQDPHIEVESPKLKNGESRDVDGDVIVECNTEDVPEEDMFNQQRFVEVTCNNKSQKKSKGRIHRIGKSIRDLFSCTSARSADVT